MARLSLWKDGKHSNDYKFIDRRISESFTIGGTGIALHKYLGPKVSTTNTVTVTVAQTAIGNVLQVSDTSKIILGDVVTATGVPANTTVVAKNATTITLSNDTTQPLAVSTKIGISSNASIPSYTNQSEKNIQDLLFLENRDRSYDPNVYMLRGIYQVTDNDFDLSQFGLFLTSGTLFMVFHMNDMVDTIGRKIMNGDVLELLHLVDYDSLDQDVPAALKRFYSVSDCTRASEGFSPTWWPHLWRCKLNPLVDSQEYKDIIKQITGGTGSSTTTGDLLSTLNKNLAINDAIIAEATQNLPRSGYDITPIYVQPLSDEGFIINNVEYTSDDSNIDASDFQDTADSQKMSPQDTVHGYLTGTEEPPNGFMAVSGVLFPDNPQEGDFALRTDYIPNRLFRFDGRNWIKYNDVQRTDLTNGSIDNHTLYSTFANNTDTYNDQGTVKPQKQSLKNIMKPRAD